MKQATTDLAIKQLNECDHILIYGAAGNAREAILYIDYLFQDKIIGCAITNARGDEDDLFSFQVKDISQYKGIYILESICVIVAVRPSYFEEIDCNLRKAGFLNIFSYGDGNELSRLIQETAIKKKNFSNQYEMNNWLIHRRIKIDMRNMIA